MVIIIKTGAVALQGAAFGQGIGSIIEVYCHGYTAQRITDCALYEDYGYCSHKRDAGVRCCKWNAKATALIIINSS